MTEPEQQRSITCGHIILPNNLSHTALCGIVTEPDKFRCPARLQHCFTLFMV